jgi:cytochrome c-type biogenesis protein CcmH
MRRSRGLGWLPWVLLAAVAAVTLGVVATRSDPDRSPGARVTRITEALRCLECSGETVAESQSEFSNAVRSEVARLVATGRSDDQVRDALADLYGERILLTPSADGIGAVVWVAPLVAILLGAAGLAFAFARWRREPRLTASPDDEVLVARARRAR